MNARHAAPDDASFRTSLLKHLGGAVALVVVVAAAFAGIGRIGQQEPTPVAADLPEQEQVEEPEESDEPDEAEEPDDVEEPEEAEDPDEAEPEEAEEPEEPEPDEAEESQDDESEDDADDADDQDAEPAHPPAEVTVQVLDGARTDGGAAANRAAGELRDGGYNVVAQNTAVAYEVTTVLWTSGNEDKARQVAAALGAGEVRQQPGNLSEGVDVHVVVGADRA